MVHLGRMRDLDLIQVSVACSQYNPVTRELRLYERVDYEIQVRGWHGVLPHGEGQQPLRAGRPDPVLGGAEQGRRLRVRGPGRHPLIPFYRSRVPDNHRPRLPGCRRRPGRLEEHQGHLHEGGGDGHRCRRRRDHQGGDPAVHPRPVRRVHHPAFLRAAPGRRRRDPTLLPHIRQPDSSHRPGTTP